MSSSSTTNRATLRLCHNMSFSPSSHLVWSELTSTKTGSSGWCTARSTCMKLAYMRIRHKQRKYISLSNYMFFFYQLLLSDALQSHWLTRQILSGWWTTEPFPPDMASLTRVCRWIDVEKDSIKTRRRGEKKSSPNRHSGSKWRCKELCSSSRACSRVMHGIYS